jgi:predicted CXXCH cytochrome family protein
VKCHDPHASDNSAGLVKKGSDLCFTCHAAEKALAKAKTVHAPFAKGECAKCHDAHASANPAQLVLPARQLCAKCHDPKSAKTAAAHKGFPMAGTDCASCHNPHASDQPGLVRAKPHQVFATCNRCHTPSAPKPQDLGKTNDLCFRCHGAVKVAAQKPGAHKALQGPCVACHTPHAADDKGLVKGNERALCLSCHADVKKLLDTSFTIHPLKAEGGRCTICHAPHQSDQKRLLKSSGAELCVTCHPQHGQFSHPFGPGVVDPRNGQTMTCLSCHGPHGTQFASILLADARRDLCVLCHKSEGPSLGTTSKKEPGQPNAPPSERPK